MAKKEVTSIDHVGVTVSDLAKSRAFYAKALAPLGFEDNNGSFGPLALMEGKKATTAMHLAFRVGERKQVDAFHQAALKAGAKDNGGPGVRKEYAPNYYAAFVIDLDGNNLEAVCFAE
jgi:catechol 2,3-dioxygenase-like lactoylglutathione lyase family enzyme